jgi:hypothetical protein
MHPNAKAANETMKLTFHKSSDIRYCFAFWDRIRQRDGTTIRQIRWGRYILNFVFSQRLKTPTDESTSAYLDMEMAGRQIAEAKESWREDSMEWVFLTLCDVENTIQSAKAKVGRVLQYQHNETGPFVDATEMKP